MATVTKQARKKIWAFLALGTFVGLLLLPLFLSLPAGAGDTPAPAASPDAKPVEKTRDVWYKTEGPAVGAPAPNTTNSPKDNPPYISESRVRLWVLLQYLIYTGTFVFSCALMSSTC